MATINRSVYVSLEPSPLSMRLPASQATLLNLTYRTQQGTLVTYDLKGRLELTGRSGAASQVYSVLAKDTANGTAQASIPSGSLTDPNGYRLLLQGIFNGEPMLLAAGTVALTAADTYGMGTPLEVEPPAETITTERIDIILEKGHPVTLIVGVWADAEAMVPLDLTGIPLSASIYAAKGGAILATFSIAPAAETNMRTLGLTQAQVDVLPDTGWWTLTGVQSGTAVTYCEGTVTTTEDATP